MSEFKTVTDILNHIVKVCIRNSDGSLNLGTYEVDLLEKALQLSKGFTTGGNIKISKFETDEGYDDDGWSESEDWSVDRDEDY